MKRNSLSIGSKTILFLALGLFSCSPMITNAQTATSSVHLPMVSTSTNSSYTYPIVDTGQTHCYNNTQQIACPLSGTAFTGQDAQYIGNAPSYKDNGDGTVSDLNTGLMWQKTPGSKVTFAQAVAGAKSLNLGSYSDWRLPTIKELYSLINFEGTDPNTMSTDTSGLKPFIDTQYFDFKYGDTSASERVIDAQYWSSTEYVSTTMNGIPTTFGVNFADGRIKGYGRSAPRGEMTQYVRYVRGNTNYGINSFVNNNNGTITDNATGLMWSQADSGKGMNWEAALTWVQTKNAEKYLGYADWRLPNAKELQSIVDYKRSPDTTNSAAIDPVFTITSITNELGKTDYPFFWTSTTHASSNGTGTAGAYIAFGRAMGYMNGTWMDVHGAGAQRSDPKNGNPADYSQGRGPQGDSVHVNNYVRLVRGTATFTTNTSAPTAPTGQQPNQSPMGGQAQPPMQGQQSQQGLPPTMRQGQLPGNPNTTNNRTGGRVTKVNGGTILVENLQGTASIVTNTSTEFTANGQASNLASVTIGKFIEVTGQLQPDGTWLAVQVTISDTPPAQGGQGLPPMNGQGQQPGLGQPPMDGMPPAR